MFAHSVSLALLEVSQKFVEIVTRGGIFDPSQSAPASADTGGEGSFTQWVHSEFVVSLEAIRPVITQQVCGEFF